MSKSLVVVFCGFQWYITTNQTHYRCTTRFSEDECKVEVECDSGRGKVDVVTQNVYPIVETLSLQCKEETQSKRLTMGEHFAAAITCSKELQ